MFFLSCLDLNDSDRDVRRVLSDPYRIHQEILNAWDDDTAGRVLFRSEVTPGGAARLVVQHPHEADWRRCFRPVEGRKLLCRFVQKQVELQLTQGHRLRFLLRANPTAKRRATGSAEGAEARWIRAGLRTPEEQLAWLARQGETRSRPDGVPTGGFRILEAEIRGSGDQVAFQPRDRKRLTHHGALFEGRLEVTDVDSFLSTIEHGVGAGKAVGFGLLSLAPSR